MEAALKQMELQRLADATAAARGWHRARVGVEVLYHALLVGATVLTFLSASALGSPAHAVASGALGSLTIALKGFAAFCQARLDAAEADLAELFGAAGLAKPPARRGVPAPRRHSYSAS